MRKLCPHRIVFSLVVVLFLAMSLKSQAQQDSTAAAKADSISMYLTPLEYAFMMHEETKFMLRAPAFGFGAEVEVLPYFTLMAESVLKPEYRSLNYFFDAELILTAQLRWYYGSRKKKVRNMSGNYVALGYDDKVGVDDSRFYARWGLQRRFLDYGLIDIGLNVGFGELMERKLYFGLISVGEGYFIQSRSVVGLGFVFNKLKTLDSERLCPVLKCYEKETFILKISTSDLFSISYSPSTTSTHASLQPRIGIEQKLFDLPISIGADFSLDYTWANSEGSKESYGFSNFGELSGRLHTRYYYNLKRRLRKGKSGDGFSANYLSGGVYQNRRIQSGLPEIFKDHVTGYFFTTGIQRTFGEHFYFDVEAGVQQDPYPYGSNPRFYGDIQLGLKL